MTTQRHSEKGNVLFYILIAVVLLAALSFSMTRGSGDSASGIAASRISDEVKTQAQTIRSALLECNLLHNMGYPAQPVSGLARDVLCQLEDGVSTTPIFSQTANRTLGLTPRPFTTGWQYTVNGATTPPSISIQLNDAINCTADRGLQSALEILATQFSPDEIDPPVCNGTTATFRLFIVKGV